MYSSSLFIPQVRRYKITNISDKFRMLDVRLKMSNIYKLLLVLLFLVAIIYLFKSSSSNNITLTGDWFDSIWFEWTVGWLIEVVRSLTDWLVDLLISLLINWYFHWLNRWMIDWSWFIDKLGGWEPKILGIDLMIDQIVGGFWFYIGGISEMSNIYPLPLPMVSNQISLDKTHSAK